MNDVHYRFTAILNIVQEACVGRSLENSSADRRAAQREQLIACAEQTIRERGLASLRARDLAADMGCAVGAIYNLVSDLNELVLLVAQRTQAALAAHLDAVTAASDKTDADILLDWASAYLVFAATHPGLWRALFEFQLASGGTLPDWFMAEQAQLFRRVEDRLAILTPDASAQDRATKARILFSAVHGIVSLALAEKLITLPLATIDAELRVFVGVHIAGLRAER